jgi:hypothetical protein
MFPMLPQQCQNDSVCGIVSAVFTVLGVILLVVSHNPGCLERSGVRGLRTTGFAFTGFGIFIGLVIFIDTFFGDCIRGCLKRITFDYFLYK